MQFWKHRPGADGIVTVRRERTVALRADPSRPLKVNASDRGGIRVQPSPDGSFSALVCMAAGAGSSGPAEAILDRLIVESDRGELKLSGPESGDWAAQIILSVAPAAALDLSARNGELALRDVNGQQTLRTTNDPISLADVGGVVEAQAVNGPIHYRGHAGDVRFVAQNEPVGVDLDAPEWIGRGLNASGQNEPVKRIAPPGLKGGDQVEGSASSLVKWNGLPQPIEGQGSGSRTCRFGEGPVVVRLSTVNGPVEIKATRRGSRGLRI